MTPRLDCVYTKIYSIDNAFAALKADGSIVAWGGPYNGGKGVPSIFKNFKLSIAYI
jgi:hypothetical protein